MNRNFLIIFLLLLANSTTADGLEALGDMYMILTLGVLFIISTIVLLISLIITFNNRLTQKEFKSNVGIYLSCSALIICSLIAIETIGSKVDPGFNFACGVIIIICSLLITINYQVGLKPNDIDKNKKANRGIYILCSALIIFSLIVITAVDREVDRLFLFACKVIIIISVLLMVVNFKVGFKRKKNDENK